MLIHPFTSIIAGPTGSGKTHFLVRLLESEMINPKPDKIIYCYSRWQPLYDYLLKSVNKITFQVGLFDNKDINPKQNNLIILDDLLEECNNNKICMDLFTVNSHHMNTSVFVLTQNIFSKGKYTRTMSINAHYLFIFKNPRDKLQIYNLARQIYPKNMGYLIDSYEDATVQPHGYLFIDFKQNTKDDSRLQTGILPEEKQIIYKLT